MPGGMTEAATNAVLDQLLGGRAYVPPATLEVGLSLRRASALGRIVEPRDPSYRRAVVPNDADHFPPARLYGGVKANTMPIVFPAPSRDWGVILSLFVAEPGGRILFSSDLDEPRIVLLGDRPVTITTAGLRFAMV